MKHIHVLNLGAGVQSTTLALLARDGKLVMDGEPVRFEAAIFADTGEEPMDPGENVYDHLRWLAEECKEHFPVIQRSVGGRLGDHLLQGRNSSGGRFASIPAFTLRPDGTEGKIRRQCTREYKIEVVERSIRRDVLGLRPRQRCPKDVRVHQYIGISLDEISRMHSAKRLEEIRPRLKWSVRHYPLCEVLAWTREDCRKFLAGRVPHRVPRSACVFCPFHSNEEWQRIKSRNGPDWARIVEVDRSLRTPGNVVNRNMDQLMFLHRSCKPIDQVDFAEDKRQQEFDLRAECTGMCGD